MSIHFGQWNDDIHDDFEQVKRIEAGKKLTKNIAEINKDEEWVVIQGSSDEPYKATLHECTCPDFAIRQGAFPCKHIYCLAWELGLLDDLPVYKKGKGNFDAKSEIEKYKDLYKQGKISADTYTKICTVLAKVK